MRRQPAKTTTRYAGVMIENSASWRPAIAESARVVAWVSWPSIGASRPPSVVIGMPSEPKATGVVLARRPSVAAVIGGKPRPASIDAVIATGAPKPAIPSISAPKQKATRITWIRRSPVARASDRRMTSKSPLATDRL
jgi:hypothetical protein